MKKLQLAVTPALIIAVIAATAGYLVGSTRSLMPQEARASERAEVKTAATETATTLVAKQAPAASPTAAISDRDVYYPGTEDLAPDEMRVVACGTGMPNARPKQAAACWLVELGNGDKFIFDIGTGSAERLSAMKIPYDFLDKVFIGHLHSDHIGDMDALWIGGVIANRVNPMRVWVGKVGHCTTSILTRRYR